VKHSEFKGVILAGGEGRRLRPLTYYFQKCMIPIGSMQKPLLEYIVRLMRYHGIKDIIMLVGYKHEQIENYFGDGARFGVSIQYVVDKPEMRGTGGALLNAYEEGSLSPDEPVIIHYGDIITNIDLSDMMDFHRRMDAAVTVALAKGYRLRVGVADLDDDGRIKKFVEKPVLDVSVSIGVVAADGVMHRVASRMVREGVSIDIMRDIIPALIERGHPVYGYVTDAFWYDLGSIERFEKLSNSVVDDKLGFLLKP